MVVVIELAAVMGESKVWNMSTYRDAATKSTALQKIGLWTPKYELAAGYMQRLDYGKVLRSSVCG